MVYPPGAFLRLAQNESSGHWGGTNGSAHLEPLENMKECKSVGVHISRGRIERGKGAFAWRLFCHALEQRIKISADQSRKDKINTRDYEPI